MRARSGLWVAAVVALGAAVLTTGPLFRIRTWWSFDDPLEDDPVVVAVRAAVGVGAVAVLATGGRWRALAEPAAALWLALVAWLALSTSWSVRPAVTIREALVVGGTLAAGAALVAVRPAIALVGAWVGVHAGLAWSAIATIAVQPGTQDESGYWTGIFFNRNSLALVAAVGVVLGVILLVESRVVIGWRGVGLLVPATAALGIVADLVLIARSRSLSPMVALALGAVAAGAALAGRRVVAAGRANPSRVVAVGGAAALVLALAGWLARAPLADAVGRDATLSGRSAVWGVARDWWERRPLLGHGYLGADATADFQYDVFLAQGMVLDSAHSSFLDVLLGGGIVGALLLVTATGATLWFTAVQAVRGGSSRELWPLVLVVFALTEHAIETLLVGGQITTALLGFALVPVAAAHRAGRSAAEPHG